MFGFKKLTNINGFDFYNLNSSVQNDFAWSITELDDYIYVGTGRNLTSTTLKNIMPPSITKLPLIAGDSFEEDNLAEIWRYKKDHSLPWMKVYKSSCENKIEGFNTMITHKPLSSSPAIYAAGTGKRLTLLKSLNGIRWLKVDTSNVEGTMSNSMVSLNGILYLSTINTECCEDKPLLYYSRDPEFHKFKPILFNNSSCDIKGSIYNMIEFNDKLYLFTTGENGVEVWRSKFSDPQRNEWIKVACNGFGDESNTYPMSMGIYNDCLYVSTTKYLPLSLAVPAGFDIVRINKNDNWQLVVGGNPLVPTHSCCCKRNCSVSGFNSGFNNPFNLYAWQIKEYKGKLLISTLDSSSNMEIIRDILLANVTALETEYGKVFITFLINLYSLVITLLDSFNYEKGFNFYVSDDGVNFRTLFNDGLKSNKNSGGRILFVDSNNDLFVGTTNSLLGAEVWKGSIVNSADYSECNSIKAFSYLDCLDDLNDLYNNLLSNLYEIYNSLARNKDICINSILDNNSLNNLSNQICYFMTHRINTTDDVEGIKRLLVNINDFLEYINL